MSRLISAGLVLLCLSSTCFPGVLQYGDKDVLGTGSYAVDPTTGATLEGLAVDSVTFGAAPVRHGFPFAPSDNDFQGTDQIYVGSQQTGFRDGYSVASSRIAGPQTLRLDYRSLLEPGRALTSLTLGVAADDFQSPVFGQPFSARINDAAASKLTDTLNSLSQSGPRVQFFTIGLDLSLLNSSGILTLSIDQGGDGGDGWAIDFLTIGVTTAAVAVPEPSTIASAALAMSAALAVVVRRRVRPTTA